MLFAARFIRKKYPLILLSCFFLIVFHAPDRLLAEPEPFSDPVAETLWPCIEIQLDKQGPDTSLHFIRTLVREHCQQDADCLFDSYYAIMHRLERRFDLLAAIYVCKEMARVAHRQNNPNKEGAAYKNMNRYYAAIGNVQQAAITLDKALVLFRQAGNDYALTSTRLAKLVQNLNAQTTEDILPAMDALLAESEARGDQRSMQYLHLRMIEHTLDAQCYEEAERYLDAIEQIPISDPMQQQEYGFVISALLGRAKIARVRSEVEEAERLYQEALRLCEEEPSRWLEIHVLNTLAELEWSRGGAELAKSYLDLARSKAEKLDLHELLAHTYAIQTHIAEEEGRFEDALTFSRKERHYAEQFEEKSAGFDVKNYYLNLEKEQLATEKKNKELELSLAHVRLRNSKVVVGLATLLAAVFLLAFIFLRKRQQELARQNILIQQQTEQLQSQDAAKSRFFANVSHELRTPLTLLLGPIHTLLKENQLSARQVRLLSMASRSGAQLRQLVDEILDLRKLELGKMELDLKPTQLQEFFTRYAVQFESMAESKQIDFSFTTGIDENVTALIDPEKYRQILYNLLSNAFKFTPAGGWIKAELSIRGEQLLLEVADTGPGIHPDDLPHVFDRYFQTTRTDQPAEGGTGIGLALCQAYTKLFGGTIQAESELGAGTAFRMSFPLVLADLPIHDAGTLPAIALAPQPQTGSQMRSLAAAAQSPRRAGDTRPTLLVVEDNPDLQAYLRAILSDTYRILTADNGQAALDCLRATSDCQLVLSDLMMPVMDGYQLLEALKSDDATRHLPVIMLTARAEARDRLHALRIGVDDYLTKPFDEEELLARIKNLLNNQAIRRQAIATEPPTKTPAPLLSQADQAWLQSFEGYVRDHLSENTLSVPELAHEFAMSESTLLRQLKRLTGLSPIQYLLEMRLDQARQLLENNHHDSITQLAAKVGYGDARSFSRAFKKRFGKLPTELVTC